MSTCGTCDSIYTVADCDHCTLATCKQCARLIPSRDGLKVKHNKCLPKKEQYELGEN